jgi:hypothetical protein
MAARPILVNDVGQNGKLLALLHLVLGPIVGKFVARFLAHHALLNPLVASAMLLPSLSGTV